MTASTTVCCRALIASCLACEARQTISEFCASHPSEIGCPATPSSENGVARPTPQPPGVRRIRIVMINGVGFLLVFQAELQAAARRYLQARPEARQWTADPLFALFWTRADASIAWSACCVT